MTKTAQKQVTIQEINEHCESLKHTALVFSLDEPLVSVRIIRQLQDRTDLNHVIGCDCMSFSGCCGVLEHRGMDVVCNECGQKYDVKPIRIEESAAKGMEEMGFKCDKKTKMR